MRVRVRVRVGVGVRVRVSGVPTWKGVCRAMRITSAGTAPRATATAAPIMCRIWCSAKAAP